MNIFIYGNASFKSDIHKVFEHSNIKFRLSDNDSIQEIKTLIELRTAIETYPKDIFLIDDAKIFRKNALNQKIKFLKPKGAIEEEFIKSHDIDDISIDSLDELPKYVIQKLEEANDVSVDDDYHNSRENADIHESIIDIVDDAYNSEETDENTNNSDKIDNIDEEDDKIELDDELSSLLSAEENTESEDEEIELEDDLLSEIESEYENDLLGEEEIEPMSENNALSEDEVQSDQNNVEGENMPDEFSELDNINESDILAALDGLEDVDVNSIMPAKMETAPNDSAISQSSMGVEVGGSNVNEIAALITSLLNNKTLEITIKVKA